MDRTVRISVGPSSGPSRGPSPGPSPGPSLDPSLGPSPLVKGSKKVYGVFRTLYFHGKVL